MDILPLISRHKTLLLYSILVFCLGMYLGQFLDLTPDSKPEKRSLSQITASESTNADVKIIQSVAQEQQKVVKSIEEYSRKLIVNKGDSFISLLVKAGINDLDAFFASRSLKAVFDVEKLHVGQKITVYYGKGNGQEEEFSALKIDRPYTEIVLLKGSNGEFSVKEIRKTFAVKMVRAKGVITSSLFELAETLKIPMRIMVEAVKAYSFDVDFQREIRKGNKFEVIYEEQYDSEDNKVHSGNLIFASLVLEGRELKMYRYTISDGNTDYYDEDGHMVRKTLLKTPINGAIISSFYGRRKHPILGYTKVHSGVDFAAPRGTPIYAGGDGVLTKVGWWKGYGKYIKIKHSSEYSTAYGHINNFTKGMRKGKRVKQGQIIAYVGSTGNSTGPHLHYEIWVNGKHTNPLKLNMKSSKKLTGKELELFIKHKEKIDDLLDKTPA